MIVIKASNLTATTRVASPAAYDEACRAQFQEIPGLQWDKSLKHYSGDAIAIEAALEACEQAKIAKVRRNYEEIYNSIQPPQDLDERLLPFQVSGIAALNQILHDYGAAMLLDEMGLGKTPQSIILLDELSAGHTANLYAPRIVICPAMVASNWRREVRKWSWVEQQETESPAFPKSEVYPYYIYSYEEFQLALKIKEPKKRAGKPHLLPLPPNPGYIVFDEAHYLANSSSKRASATATYCEANPKMLRLALTGSLFKTYVRSLHCLLDILFPSQFGTFFSFTRRYADGHFEKINLKDDEERRIWVSDGASNLEELNARIALRSIRRTKKEVLQDLPAKRRSVIDVPLPHKIRKAMRDMAKASAIAQELGATSSVHKLLSTVEEHKIDAACDLASECISQGKKPLILSLRRETAELIASRLNIVCAHGGTPAATREDVLKAQSAATSTIDACQIGMNLTNFDVTIFVGFDWDPTKLLQAEDRIHRIGQHDSCMIYYLCGESSIDEIVRSKVIDRLDIFSNVIGKEDSILREDLNSVSEEDVLATWAARIEKGI